jgi:hypothetical protein
MPALSFSAVIPVGVVVRYRQRGEAREDVVGRSRAAGAVVRVEVVEAGEQSGRSRRAGRARELTGQRVDLRRDGNRDGSAERQVVGGTREVGIGIGERKRDPPIAEVDVEVRGQSGLDPTPGRGDAGRAGAGHRVDTGAVVREGDHAVRAVRRLEDQGHHLIAAVREEPRRGDVTGAEAHLEALARAGIGAVSCAEDAIEGLLGAGDEVAPASADRGAVASSP